MTGSRSLVLEFPAEHGHGQLTAILSCFLAQKEAKAVLDRSATCTQPRRAHKWYVKAIVDPAFAYVRGNSRVCEQKLDVTARFIVRVPHTPETAIAPDL